MAYVRPGRSGLAVSRLCLGCLTYATPGNSWALVENGSTPIFRRAIEPGINFFDTATIYSKSNSEKVLGRAIREYAKRDEVTIGSARTRHPGDAAEALSTQLSPEEIAALEEPCQPHAVIGF